MTGFVDVVGKDQRGTSDRFDIRLFVQVEYNTGHLTLLDVPKTVADELIVGDRYSLVMKGTKTQGEPS